MLLHELPPDRPESGHVVVQRRSGNEEQPVTSGVVVTGGASGIGKACAEYLAEAGRPVAVWDLNGDGAKQVADSLGVPSIGLQVDVADEAQLTSAVEATRKALPSIGGLVHSAGMVDPSPIGAVDWGRWQRLLDVNLTAHARITQLLLPDLLAALPGAAIVGIASIEGVIGHASDPVLLRFEGRAHRPDPLAGRRPRAEGHPR